MSHKSFVWLCLLPLAVVTAAFFLVPMARLVVTGAEGPQGLTGYLAILSEARYRATLINTVVLAAATTIVTLIVATIAGTFLQRHRFPGRSLLIAMLTFPLAFPGVVVGFMIILAWSVISPTACSAKSWFLPIRSTACFWATSISRFHVSS
jgi:putative spermidine/putrescine transport system permease protein